MKVLKYFSIAYAFTVVLLLFLLSFSTSAKSIPLKSFGYATNLGGNIHTEELAQKLAMGSSTHQK